MADMLPVIPAVAGLVLHHRTMNNHGHRLPKHIVLMLTACTPMHLNHNQPNEFRVKADGPPGPE
jgi:hypothetical protein